MNVDKDRLAKVAFGRDGGYALASGYLVTPDLVLTARHAVGEEPQSLGREGLVRFVRGTDDWQPATVVWTTRGDAGDAALLRLKAPRSDKSELRWGQCERFRAEWVGGGFPAAAVSEHPDGKLGESVGLSGTVEPLGGAVSGRYDLTVIGPAPDPELWRGLSGGPVFVDGHLVGVIESARTRFSGARLWATPTAVLFADTRFVELLGHPSLAVLAPAPARSIPVATAGYFVKPSAHGASVTRSTEPLVVEVQPRPRPVLHLARPFAGLRDRAAELARVRQAVATHGVVVVSGRRGAGKTALLRVLSHDDLAAFDDGVIYIAAREKSRVALFQDIVDRFFISSVAVSMTDALFAERCKALRACIILDDFGLELGDLEQLANMAPSATWVAATERTFALGPDSKGVEVGGLPGLDGLALLEDVLERRLDESERAVGNRLVEHAAGHPATLVAWASRARREELSLAALENLLKSEEATPRTWASWLPTLGRRERRIFAALGVFAGVVLRASDVFALTGDALAEDTLEELASSGLVERVGTAYRLAPGAPLNESPELASTFLEHVAGWARRASGEPEVLLQAADRLVPGIVSALQSEHARLGIEAARAMAPALSYGALPSAPGHALLRQLLSATRAASHGLGDVSTEAWAVHQLGVFELCSGNPKTAARLLREAAAIRRATGDAAGAEFSKAQLAAISKPLILLKAMVVIALLGTVGVAWAIIDHGPGTQNGGDGGHAATGGTVAETGGLTGAGGTTRTADAADESGGAGGRGNDGTGGRDASSGPTPVPNPVLSPAQLSWTAIPVITGDVRVSPPKKRVRLRNTGTAPLAKPQFSLAPPSGHDFSLLDSACSGSALAPRRECTLEIAFKPSKAGTQVAELKLDGYANVGVRLKGEGVTPSLLIRPSKLEFVAEATEPVVTKDVQVMNEGGAPIKIERAFTTVTSEGTGNDFAVDPRGCAAPLQPKMGCSMVVSFLAKQSGKTSGKLTVRTSSEEKSVELVGTVQVIE